MDATVNLKSVNRLIMDSYADLAIKLIAIGEQVGEALSRDPAAGDGVHKFWEFHQFRGDVVEGVECVLERAPFSPWIVGVIKSGFEAPGHDEETGNSHRSERVEAVGILDDRGFESGRLLTSGIAMGAHSRRDMDRSIPIYPKLIEATKGKFRRAAS